MADKFNGLDTDDAILVSIPQVGWIRIPVHFSLDRFGNRGINGWDGNSITLDKDMNIIGKSSWHYRSSYEIVDKEHMIENLNRVTKYLIENYEDDEEEF